MHITHSCLSVTYLQYLTLYILNICIKFLTKLKTDSHTKFSHNRKQHLLQKKFNTFVQFSFALENILTTHKTVLYKYIYTYIVYINIYIYYMAQSIYIYINLFIYVIISYFFANISVLSIQQLCTREFINCSFLFLGTNT